MTTVEGFSGWSISDATVLYAGNGTTDTSFWGACLHSTGARLVFDWKIYDASTIRASNNLANITHSGFNSRNCLGIGYFPPGNSGFGAAHPGADNFVPNDGFRLGYTGYDSNRDTILWNDTYDGSNAIHTFHFISKDDDLFVILERNSNASRILDYMWCFGTLIGTLAHPTLETSSDRAQECTIGCLNGISGLTSSDSPFSFFRTPTQDGGTPPTSRARVRADGAFCSWQGDSLSTNVYDVETIGKEVYVTPFLYYARNADIPSEGVIRGNGMKGALDPEKILIVQGDGLSQRQTLDGGNYLYVGGNIAIGWDPANGPIL
jgi:hypothetical protein